MKNDELEARDSAVIASLQNEITEKLNGRWVLVPKEPTPAMVSAAYSAALAEDAEEVWNDMIKAAPLS